MISQCCAAVMLAMTCDVEYAKTGKKALNFKSAFAALGLVFDLSDSGVITIKHTDDPKAELLESLNRILEEQTQSTKQAEALRGRLRWFTSHLFGRSPCEAMRRLSVRTQGRDMSSRLDDSMPSFTWRMRLRSGCVLRVTGTCACSLTGLLNL